MPKRKVNLPLVRTQQEIVNQLKTVRPTNLRNFDFFILRAYLDADHVAPFLSNDESILPWRQADPQFIKRDAAGFLQMINKTGRKRQTLKRPAPIYSRFRAWAWLLGYEDIIEIIDNETADKKIMKAIRDRFQ